jgi:hypothetical protein
MSLLHQPLIKNFLNQEKMLQESIEEIESIFNSDVVVYYGIIEPILIRELTDVIRVMSENKNKRKRLTLLISSYGGDFREVPIFFANIFDKKYYEEIYVIVNGKLQSAGTLLSFYADKLYVSNKYPIFSTFGMIDPIIDVQDTMGNPGFVSAFIGLQTHGIPYEFIEKTDDIEQSLKINNNITPPKGFESELNLITSIKEMRRFAFDALINHNLKKIKDDKQRAITAINLINKLMYNGLYHHEHDITPDVLERWGLIMHPLDRSTAKTFEEVFTYIKLISSYITNGQDGGSIATNYGNVLKCLIQTKDKSIF